MYVFDASKQASLAVQGTDNRFPVRRIFCVGRNYEAHAREMGNDPDREHVSTLSQVMTLALGDIVMTGTPAGVGAVVPGDVITGGVDGIAELQVTIGPLA